MKTYELKFVHQELTIELEPEEVTAVFYEAAVPQEAQEIVAECRYLGLAVGMPYGFQLYTEEQWEDLRRRIGTFPSMMQRHMRPFFITMVTLDPDDETGGFPQVLSVPESLARYARMEEWPMAGEESHTAGTQSHTAEKGSCTAGEESRTAEEENCTTGGENHTAGTDGSAPKTGGLSALLIRLDDGRTYVLRADEKEQFLETMCEQ